MVQRTVLAYGGLDILVCSAGIATSAPVTETSLAEWQRNHDVLARGYFLTAREAFRVLKAQGAGGSIVFVGSKNALVAGANASAYSSAKAAALHLARCLAEEGGSDGIRVNTVNPDAVIEGSSIWSSEWKAERASTYGVSEDDLPAFYRRRTVLRRERLPGGRCRGDRVLRRPARGQVDRQRRQRRRRRHRRVPAMSASAAQPEPVPVLELTGISKRFDATQALANVSLALHPGEVHALLGENGAGKSTLIKVMTGIHRPDTGTIAIDGEVTTFGSSAEAQRCGRRRDLPGARDLPRPQRRREHLHQPPEPRRARPLAAAVRRRGGDPRPDRRRTSTSGRRRAGWPSRSSRRSRSRRRSRWTSAC